MVYWIFSAIADRVNFQSFYVAVTRMKNELHVVADNIDDLKHNIMRIIDKKSTLDHTLNNESAVTARDIQDSKPAKQVDQAEQIRRLQFDNSANILEQQTDRLSKNNGHDLIIERESRLSEDINRDKEKSAEPRDKQRQSIPDQEMSI